MNEVGRLGIELSTWICDVKNLMPTIDMRTGQVSQFQQVSSSILSLPIFQNFKFPERAQRDTSALLPTRRISLRPNLHVRSLLCVL